MTEDYFTSDDLNIALARYNNYSVVYEEQLIISPKELEKLLIKINSIMNKVLKRKITSEKVRKQGKLINEFTKKEGAFWSSQLPMHFIKENHVYYPTFFTDDKRGMVGVEVINGAVCYLTIHDDERKGRLYFGLRKDDGWSGYAKTKNCGTYVLDLGNTNTNFINWEGVPWGDLK